MTAPDLKPCPFCGGKPYLANVAMAGCAYVVCTDCRLQTDDGSQERVTAAWNTRAPLADALAVPEIAALVEAAKRAMSAFDWYENYSTETASLRAALRAIGEPRIEALAVTTWQPIETAPKDGMNFLAWFPSHKRHCVAWRQRHTIDGDLWASFLDAYPDRWSDQPTHWMPLPEPPAALRAIGDRADG